VRAISPRELRDAYQLRGILEQVATEFIPEFTPEDVQYLEEEFAAMQGAVESGDLQAVSWHNRNFHCHIMHRCENTEVVRIWESLRIGLRSRLNTQRLARCLPQSIALHRPIIDAFRAGDMQRAGALLREHCFQVVEDIQ
jgi:DNA-binding GntR family transcriptional regulator